MLFNVVPTPSCPIKSLRTLMSVATSGFRIGSLGVALSHMSEKLEAKSSNPKHPFSSSQIWIHRSFRICFLFRKLDPAHSTCLIKFPTETSEIFSTMGSQTASKNIITLGGSSAIVCEYFGYAANSILHLNGVYPEETFERVRKHELRLLLCKKMSVKSYLSRLDKQISEWLEAGRLHEIELLIMTKATNEVLQSWNFIIKTDGEAAEKGEKSDKEIMNEIRDVLRRISATYRVFPLLNEPCIFNVVAHIDKDGTIAFKWKDSEHERSYMERFRAFSTKILKAASSVSFKKRKSDDQMHEVDTMVPKKKSKLDD
ncbi:unnamed protein product [Lactuca virosa]|uniref:HORMA domain-containing protein n=1 Tax=Lactuca virosa TaxID=75947 RepID=A0AAU9LVH6_9ASTR|nr:unnamed protein product [Lactuca virosa]CAH1413671.1 unnamed protein product [Lactuca virosa]